MDKFASRCMEPISLAEGHSNFRKSLCPVDVLLDSVVDFSISTASSIPKNMKNCFLPKLSIAVLHSHSNISCSFNLMFLMTQIHKYITNNQIICQLSRRILGHAGIHTILLPLRPFLENQHNQGHAISSCRSTTQLNLQVVQRNNYHQKAGMFASVGWVSPHNLKIQGSSPGFITSAGPTQLSWLVLMYFSPGRL